MKPNKILSPLQKVCLQYGKDCREIHNSSRLANFLKRQGYFAEAREVERAKRLAREIARNNYFRERKILQPDWKDWHEQMEETLMEY